MDKFCVCRGGGTLRQARKTGAWLYFKDLVIGAGFMGEYTNVVALPGSKGSIEGGLPNDNVDLLRLFVDRLYAGFLLRPLPQRFSSSRTGKLRVVIAGNKRFTARAARTHAVYMLLYKTIQFGTQCSKQHRNPWGRVVPSQSPPSHALFSLFQIKKRMGGQKNQPGG
eukprot:4635499-Amphidinium_carterae.1